MSKLSDRMYAQARIVPLKPANRVKTVTKNHSGGLDVELSGGDTFTIDAGDEMFQAFVVYTMLNTDCH